MLDRFDDSSAHIYELIRRHQQEADQLADPTLPSVEAGLLEHEVAQNLPLAGVAIQEVPGQPS